MTPASFALVLGSVVFQAFAQLLLKKGMVSLGPVPPLAAAPVQFVGAFALNPWLAAGVVSCVLSLGIWLAVLARLPVSVAYPMLSLGYVMTAVAGVLWFGETLTLQRAAAILLIMAGVALMAQPRFG